MTLNIKDDRTRLVRELHDSWDDMRALGVPEDRIIAVADYLDKKMQLAFLEGIFVSEAFSNDKLVAYKKEIYTLYKRIKTLSQTK